jgi:hypothetical protein
VALERVTAFEVVHKYAHEQLSELARGWAAIQARARWSALA